MNPGPYAGAKAFCAALLCAAAIAASAEENGDPVEVDSRTYDRTITLHQLDLPVASPVADPVEDSFTLPRSSDETSDMAPSPVYYDTPSYGIQQEMLRKRLEKKKKDRNWLTLESDDDDREDPSARNPFAHDTEYDSFPDAGEEDDLDDERKDSDYVGTNRRQEEHEEREKNERDDQPGRFEPVQLDRVVEDDDLLTRRDESKDNAELRRRPTENREAGYDAEEKLAVLDSVRNGEETVGSASAPSWRPGAAEDDAGRKEIKFSRTESLVAEMTTPIRANRDSLWGFDSAVTELPQPSAVRDMFRGDSESAARQFDARPAELGTGFRDASPSIAQPFEPTRIDLGGLPSAGSFSAPASSPTFDLRQNTINQPSSGADPFDKLKSFQDDLEPWQKTGRW